MRAKKIPIFIMAVSFLAISVMAYAAMAPLPRAKDYLTSEVVSPIILRAGTIPDDYMFPNDWVKQQDWEAIRKKYGGTKLTIMFEGTDIGAPLMTKEQFEQMSGMKLNFVGVPIAVQFEKLLISFATGGAAFDIATVVTPNMPVFVKFLEPLDDYIEKWGYDFDDYFTQFQSLMTDTPLVPGGKVYGLPNDYDQHYWHCRKKFLDQIGADGPPKTYEEVRDYSGKLKAILPDGVFPTGFMMSRDFFTWESFWDFAAPFGANYFKPGTWEPDIASAEAMKAANFQRKMIEDGYTAPGSTSWDYARQLEAWNDGKLAMCIQYPIQESYHPKMSRIADEERYHSPLPKGPGPKGRIAPHGTFTNVALSINKMSKVKDAAFIWTAFNTSTEVQYIYTVTGTGIDYGRKSIFASKVANQFYPNAQALYESVPYIYNDLQIAVGAELLAIAIPAIHNVWTGKGTAEELFPKANKEMRAVMEKFDYLAAKPPVPAPESYWNWILYPEYHEMKWVDGVGK